MSFKNYYTVRNKMYPWGNSVSYPEFRNSFKECNYSTFAHIYIKK